MNFSLVRCRRVLLLVVFAIFIAPCGCGQNDTTQTIDNDIKISHIDYSDTSSNCKYIANINSNIFHYEQCIYVAKMKEENKVFLNCDRDEAVDDGYIPCKKCCP